ncbi:hypothetical protein [Pseudomonas sp.]|uniref:hypothetical protein n=1 Tax=Pseudomonas sp. TaxID=306 RepID=UPI0025862887|nr:hypothetical protein [Pseudomonas sp.]
MSELQNAWQASLSAINHPVSRRAAQLELLSMRRDDTGRGQVFDLIGPLAAMDAKKLAVLLHNGLGVPVSVIVRARVGAEPYRAYCDAGTMFNREVEHG